MLYVVRLLFDVRFVLCVVCCLLVVVVGVRCVLIVVDCVLFVVSRFVIRDSCFCFIDAVCWCLPFLG